jgi:hypothetical protein
VDSEGLLGSEAYAGVKLVTEGNKTVPPRLNRKAVRTPSVLFPSIIEV